MTKSVQPSTVDESDVDAAVAKLDLAGVVRLLTGAARFELHGDDTIGLAPMIFSDGPSGVRGKTFFAGPPTGSMTTARWSGSIPHPDSNGWRKAATWSADGTLTVLPH